LNAQQRDPGSANASEAASLLQAEIDRLSYISAMTSGKHREMRELDGVHPRFGFDPGIILCRRR
jgi:hypothetical protein